MDIEPAGSYFLKQSAKSNRWQAAVFCQFSKIENVLYTQAHFASEIPLAPLNGSENSHLTLAIKQCLDVDGNHEHSIKNLALANILKRYNSTLHAANIATFGKIGNSSGFCVLGFAKNNQRDLTRLEELGDLVDSLARIAALGSSNIRLSETAKATEMYLREVGHDLAGCNQAVVSKLQYIVTRELSLPAIKEKAKEALSEVKNSYIISESIGITLDSQFQLRSYQKIDLDSVISDIVSELASEAGERGVRLKSQPLSPSIVFEGDRGAYKIAVGNLIHNAIKYSKSDSDVLIVPERSKGEFSVSIRNVGIGLPRGPDRNLIWDMGFRTQKAKRLHVNGSGVGLYTAKRIALAHKGRIWFTETGGETVFTMAVPYS